MPFSTRFREKFAADVFIILSKSTDIQSPENIQKLICALESIIIDNEEKYSTDSTFHETINALKNLLKNGFNDYKNEFLLESRNPLTGLSEKGFVSNSDAEGDDLLTEAKKEFVEIIMDSIKSKINKLKEIAENEKKKAALMSQFGLHKKEMLSISMIIPSPTYAAVTAVSSSDDKENVFEPAVDEFTFAKNLQVKYNEFGRKI